MSRPQRDTLTKEAYCPLCETSFNVGTSTCATCNVPLIILEQADDSLVGEELDGRYVLKEKLGSGGMGSVYRATQIAVERDVVIKVIRPDLSNDIYAAKRFLREAKMASRLSHPHTVSVFEFGQTGNGLLFLAMELLKGQTLHDLLDAEGPLEPVRACEIALQILDGLSAAHGCDIVHRDLKPANIVILDQPPGQDFVKILDFGLAKSLAGHNTTTEAGMMMGTPAYMPPEMIFGGDVDLRSDLYATGIILYELLSGALPFKNSEVKELLVAQAYTPAPPLDPSIPAPIAHVVSTLLKKDPNERFSTALEAREALAAALAVADRTLIKEATPIPGASNPALLMDDATELVHTPLPHQMSPVGFHPPAPTAMVGRSASAKKKRWPIIAAAAAGIGAIGLIVALSGAGSSEAPTDNHNQQTTTEQPAAAKPPAPKASVQGASIRPMPSATTKRPAEELPKATAPVVKKPAKVEPKGPEPKKPEVKKLEPKKAEPKKLEPKEAEPKKAEPEKAEPKKAEPKPKKPKAKPKPKTPKPKTPKPKPKMPF